MYEISDAPSLHLVRYFVYLRAWSWFCNLAKEKNLLTLKEHAAVNSDISYPIDEKLFDTKAYWTLGRQYLYATVRLRYLLSPLKVTKVVIITPIIVILATIVINIAHILKI